MVDGEVKDAIARRAGLRPNQLIATTEADADPSPVSTPATPRSEVLHTRVVTNTVGAQLPIIEIEAQAPNATGAARLANAAVAGLRDYLDSKATLQKVTDTKRLMVSGLGAPQAADVVRGPSNLLAMFVAFLVFAAGCACILGASLLARSWRAVSEEEEEAAAAAAEWAGSSDLEQERAPRWGKRLDEQPATERGAAELMIAERWPRSS